MNLLLKRSLFLSSVCVGLFFTSCKKGVQDFTLKGNVVDLTLTIPLEGAAIKLYQTPVGSTQDQLISTASIGADGSYAFKFPRDKMEKYTLVVTKSGYFDINEVVYFSSLTLEEDNVRNLSTAAKSWVKLRFINDIVLPGEELRFIKQMGKKGCAECCSDAEQVLLSVADTSIYCINDGNTYYSYLYWVSGSSNQGLRSVVTNAFDTTELILHY